MLNPPSPAKSLRSYLVQLVLVAALPLLVFASGLLYYISHEQNIELEKSLKAQANSISSVVDDKLSSIASSLEILAVTEDFNPENFSGLHQKLIRATNNLNDWNSIAVADLDGKQLIHTTFPFDSRLSPVRDLSFIKEVIKTGKPVFSSFHRDPIKKVNEFSVAVPVMKNNRISLILIGDISVNLLTRTLKRINLKDDWYASVLDKEFFILSRSRKDEQFIGTKASEAITHQMINSETGILRSFNKENIQSYSVYTKSPLTEWTVVLGFPVDKLTVLSDITKLFITLAVIVILGGIILAIRIGRKISEPITALSQSAEAFGKGYAPMVVSSGVEEVRILTRNLELASLQRIRSENTVRTLHEVSSSLAGELDMKRLLQSFTDQTVALVRAEFGAYIQVTKSEVGEFFESATLSGSSIDRDSKFPLPGDAEIFSSTFRGEGIIRLDDVTKDPRFAQKRPTDLPLKSYLAVPVISRDGEVLGGLFFGHSRPGVFTDQDEKIIGALAAQAATAIDNAKLFARATQAVELRDTFLSVASHELKTPLTSIYLQFEILKRSTLKTTGSDSKVLNLFERFQSQLERLTRLINELLDVTRIASGKMELQLEKMELTKLVKDICDNFENEALHKGSKINLTLPEIVEGVWDANRIEQVVMNLVSNAIKYGDKKPIDVSVSTDNDWAFVRIKDQGMGIAPEDQGRIFQRFERAIDSSKISGLGLGLFICKEIINKHGGDIQVDSKLGEGSTFTLRLPLVNKK